MYKYNNFSLNYFKKFSSFLILKSVSMTIINNDKRKQPETTSRYFSRPAKFRRTNDNSNHFNGASSSTRTTHSPLVVESDGEEESRLLREINDLYGQIKIKKDRIETIRINRAVQEALKKQRRETRRWLPSLEQVSQCRDTIIRNISGSDDEGLDEDESDFDFPSVDDLFEDVLRSAENKNKCNLNNVD